MGILPELFKKPVVFGNIRGDELLDFDGEKDFDPSQPRDEQGRWTHGDAAGQTVLPGMSVEHSASVQAREDRIAEENFSDSYKMDIDDAGADAKRINAILNHYDGEQVEIGGKPTDLYLLGDDVLEWSGKDGDWPSLKDRGEFMSDVNPDEYYPDFDAEFNKEFWDGVPGEVYHYTDESNVDSIMDTGLHVDNLTRGMSNRSVGSSVYTSTDPEENQVSYGNGRITIDLAKMKRDGFMPPVEMEPDVAEGQKREALAHAIGYDDYNYDYESGMSPNTVVFTKGIPAKYLRADIL